MPRVNINFEVDDQLFDEMAMQALKSKVRSLVQAEISKEIGGIVEQAVHHCAQEQAAAIVKEYTEWGATDARKELRKRIAKRAEDMQLSDDVIKSIIETRASHAIDIANHHAAELEKKSSEIDEKIEHLVKARVDAMFARGFIKALQDVAMSSGDAQ